MNSVNGYDCSTCFGSCSLADEPDDCTSYEPPEDETEPCCVTE